MKNLLLRARVVVRTSKSSFTQGDFVARQVALNFEHVRMAAICRATNRSEIGGCSHARFAVAVKSPFDRSSYRATKSLCVNEPKYKKFTSLCGRLRQKACRTRSTITFPHSSNQIIDCGEVVGVVISSTPFVVVVVVVVEYVKIILPLRLRVGIYK